MGPFRDVPNLRTPPLGRRLRLGFVGGGRGGNVGYWHYNGVRLSGHWDVVAGALSRDPDTASQSAADWCIAEDRSYLSFEDMAEAEAARDDGIEAVSICTPNFTHFPIANAFLDRGIDVILDKPMTTAVEDAEMLVAKARDLGLILAVTYPYGHHAMAMQAAQLIEEGAIGTISQVIVEYVQDWATAPDEQSEMASNWRRDPAKVGRTSAVGDIGTHALQMLRAVTKLEAEEIRADLHVCGAPKALDDTAFIKLKLSNGAPGLIWITEAAPGNHCGLRFRVFGDKGGLSWDQEFPEQLKLSPLNEPDRIYLRGQGAGMSPAAERWTHLPRGHGEALTDAWSNLYAEIGTAIAARRAGEHERLTSCHYPSGVDGLIGVRFMNACADSGDNGSSWVKVDNSGV
ncbi:MAG: Gfo/Idh/MocA family oxidoreductase [Hyphomonas sp.]|nr:Gfo/Idh/MocA family oxidoreductase [Hyphomonas sp.]